MALANCRLLYIYMLDLTLSSWNSYCAGIQSARDTERSISERVCAYAPAMVYLGLKGNGLLSGIALSSGMGFILFGEFLYLFF